MFHDFLRRVGGQIHLQRRDRHIALFHRRKVGIRPDIKFITGRPDPVEILSARILLAEHLVGGMAAATAGNAQAFNLRQADPVR